MSTVHQQYDEAIELQQQGKLEEAKRNYESAARALADASDSPKRREAQRQTAASR